MPFPLTLRKPETQTWGRGVSNLNFSCSIDIYEMVAIFFFFIMADADIPLLLKNRRHEISIGSVFRIFRHSMIWFNINFVQNTFLQLEGFCGKETPKLKCFVQNRFFESKYLHSQGHYCLVNVISQNNGNGVLGLCIYLFCNMNLLRLHTSRVFRQFRAMVA